MIVDFYKITFNVYWLVRKKIINHKYRIFSCQSWSCWNFLSMFKCAIIINYSFFIYIITLIYSRKQKELWIFDDEKNISRCKLFQIITKTNKLCVNFEWFFCKSSKFVHIFSKNVKNTSRFCSNNVNAIDDAFFICNVVAIVSQTKSIIWLNIYYLSKLNKNREIVLKMKWTTTIEFS